MFLQVDEKQETFYTILHQDVKRKNYSVHTENT